MLFGLFALAIPVVIHLFNLRRHKIVYFSNTATLKTIEQENAKTKKLKYIIVLIMRMSFIAALVFAFAYPYNPEQKLKTDDADNLIAVYIDNSMSMHCQSSEISLIEDARSSARALVRNTGPSQRFVLLTNSRQPDNEYPMNRDEMLMSIDGMQMEAPPMTFNDLYENLHMIMHHNGFKSASLFVYSDFQYNMMNTDGMVADSAIQLVVMPLASDYQQNIYVDTAWLSSPVLHSGLSNEINVRVVNARDNEVRGLPVNLEIDGKPAAFTTVDIPANGKNDVAMQLVLSGDEACNLHTATVSINDFPIKFDDKYNFVLNVRPVVKIVELSVSADMSQSSVSPVATLFSGDPSFEYRCIDPRHIDQQYFTDCQMIVVDGDADLNETMWHSIYEFANEGGTVVIFPDDDSDVSDDTLSVGMIATRHAFFDDMFVNVPDNAELPKVYKHAKINNKLPNTLTLISLQNGAPFFALNKVGNGYVFNFGSQLGSDWTNFADNPMFVPVLYKIAMLGGQTGRLSYTLGVDKNLTINDLTTFSEGSVRIRDEQGTYEMIPLVEMRNNRALIMLYDELPGSGFYTINKGDEVIGTTAWNDDRKESKMQFLDGKCVDKILKDKGLNVIAVMKYDEMRFSDMMATLVRRSMLWKSFIVIALISLLIEILVLRFWK